MIYVLQWIPSHGRTKTGRSARTFIQQLCVDMGCRKQWKIGKGGKRGSEISLLMAWHHDDHCLSLRIFYLIFGEESVEAEGLIGYLLSFNIILLGDFVTGCFIGRVIDVIAVFSSFSVFYNLVCVYADDSPFSSARSNDVVDASSALMI